MGVAVLDDSSGGAAEINTLLVSNQYFTQLKKKNGLYSAYSVVMKERSINVKYKGNLINKRQSIVVHAI